MRRDKPDAQRLCIQILAARGDIFAYDQTQPIHDEKERSTETAELHDATGIGKSLIRPVRRL